MGGSLVSSMPEFKRVKPKKRCCKSGPRCKRCPVVCKRLARDGHAVRQDSRHYLVELGLGKKTLKAARAR
jgi:aldehyde:ferredoxin oxidoreductase